MSATCTAHVPGQAKTIITLRLAAAATAVFYFAISRKDLGLAGLTPYGAPAFCCQ